MTTDESGITKPTTAYHHFARMVTTSVRDQMIAEGKDIALGNLMGEVSQRWKVLSEEGRKPYDDYAEEDRRRYQQECAERDTEILRRQEERRNEYTVGEVLESRGRTSTTAKTVVSNADYAKGRKTRVLSEEKQREKEDREAEKAEEEYTIKQQKAELNKAKAEQYQARLNYLLNQSDIFAHFGVEGEIAPKVQATHGDDGKSGVRGSARSRGSRDDLPEFDEDERALMAETENDVGTSSKITRQPSLITGGTLREYQMEGLNWMARLADNGINGILADEMGLGKTLQSIAILAHIHETKKICGPHLILVPKSTLSNWMNEFARFTPTLRVTRFHGTKDERDHHIHNILLPGKMHSERSWDILVTTYEICNMEKGPLGKIAWKYLIVDEAHRLKNENSQFAKMMKLMTTQFRLLLTGTPLQNNLHELWALLNFLLPDVFASSDQFDEWFNLDVDDTAAKQKMISQLHKLLHPFMLRRLKVDVEKTLLPKTETILFTGMSTMQKVLYKSILMRDIDTINGATASKSEGSRTAILNIVMQLRKCCNHPYLFPGLEDRTLHPMGDHLYTNCGKMFMLDKLLHKLKTRGHRVLIFSQMTRMLDILEDYCISKNYLSCRIDGNTSYIDREERIYEYNKENSEKFIFLLSTRAGGLGLNLQTADTVILYDSDWNPQADLQAQDRAHRIGQKKTVNVFRLVTDDSVEVKVVERAQQKLKLDAMVVQQGRLSEKDSKMSKFDLLDTLRFGADKIFKSKDSSISDEDIDVILDQGKKRTEEMNAKLQDSLKGDMYDFRLDGGMTSQVFEGKDYSDKANREKEQGAFREMQMQFLDTGKRERKAIASYSDSMAIAAAEEARFDKRPKLPKHMRLPRMDDWMFYNKPRIVELHEQEVRLFESHLDNGTLPNVPLHTLALLPPELHEEKERLLAEGFPEWSRPQLNSFLRALSKFGRTQYDKVAKDIGRPVDEVRRYSELFWAKGSTVFSEAEWERFTKQVERGEKRIEEIERLSIATDKLIKMYENPWEEVNFRFVGTQGRSFNPINDRYLLCLTQLHGYGNWDAIRNSVRKIERFKFDFYLMTCSTDIIGKRCETLMRSAERELLEIEKKSKTPGTAVSLKSNLSKDTTNNVIGKPGVNNVNNAKGTINTQTNGAIGSTEAPSEFANYKKTLSLMNKQLQVEALRQSKERNGLLKPEPSSSVATSIFTNPTSAPTSGQGVGIFVKSVPDEIVPELCAMIAEAGADGIQKLITTLTEKYPNISKRQAELKILELGVKEKRAEDSKSIWHLRPEFASYDSKSLGNVGPSLQTSTSIMSQNLVPRPVPTVQMVAPKRLRDEEQIDATMDPPKKAKSAFNFFLKDYRQEAEQELRADNEYSTEGLKQLLLKKWDKLNNAGLGNTYRAMEEADKKRFDSECEVYQNYLEESQKKKTKIKK